MGSHTTLRLSEALLRRAKAYARREGSTLTSVMERALAAYLKNGGDDPKASAVRLPSFGRGGVQNGVDLDRTVALLDIMDDASHDDAGASE